MDNQQILNDIRRLLKENILPRMDQLEAEVMLLRKHTWPIIQSMKEHNQLDDIKSKREFFCVLSEDEIKELLIQKCRHKKSDESLVNKEFQLIKKNNQFGKF
jgi:hypothetical protein